MDAATNNLKKKGKIKKRNRRLSKPIREMITMKKVIWRKLQQGIAEPGEERLYERLRGEIKEGIYNGIQEYKTKKRMELVLKDPSRTKFWRLMKRSNSNKSSDITAMKDKTGKLVFEPRKVGEAVLESFKTRLSGSEEKVKKKRKERKRNDVYGKILASPLDDLEYEEITSKIKNNKSPGPFGIVGEFIKNGGYTFHTYMKVWLNKMLREGEVPWKLKEGKVKLLYKKDYNLEPTNYRPITLSSVLLKVLTRLMNVRLMKVIESFDMLSRKQYGFREGRSTQDAVFILATAIEKAKAEKSDAAVAFVDLCAAYDKVFYKL